MPKYSISRTEILSDDEVLGMINNMASLRDKAMVSILYCLGCRPSELRSLRRKDFWIDQNRLWVNIESKKKRLKQGKSLILESRRSLFISLDNVFVPFIKDYIQAQEKESYLFEYGNSPNSAKVYIWRIIRAFNPNACPYLFRHSRLTKLAENGATDQQLTAWCGWKDSRPAGYYIHHTKKLIEGINNF